MIMFWFYIYLIFVKQCYFYVFLQFNGKNFEYIINYNYRQTKKNMFSNKICSNKKTSAKRQQKRITILENYNWFYLT